MIKLNKNDHVYDFSKDNQPVAVCNSGDTVIFNTKDCYSDLVVDQDYDWDRFLIKINPVNGPLYINNAMPGDTLLVKIIDIRLNDSGIIVTKPYSGVFKNEVDKKITKIVNIKDGFIELSSNKIEIRPMIGTIGTAPIAGSIAANTPNNHGGNMDNKMITINSIVELPVFVEGGLLAMGDVHALMGDGEVNGSGIECGSTITVQIEVIKGRRLINPRVIYDGRLYTIASGIDLDMASRIACKDMANIIKQYNGIDQSDAGMLMSTVGDLQVCQIVNPLSTVRFGIDLKYINYDIKDER